MTPTPQPIKDAVEKYSLGLSVKSYQPIYEVAFIAGATHPDTEKYYRERFEEEMLDFAQYCASKPYHYDAENKIWRSWISGTTWTASEMLRLYRKQLTQQDECQK